MKNVLIFLFGAGLGVGGTLLWLRKDIKKDLEKIRSEAVEKAKEELKAEADVPFEAEEEKKPDDTMPEGAVVRGRVDTEEDRQPPVVPVNIDPQVKTDYHKLVKNTNDGSVTEMGTMEDDPEAGFLSDDETGGGIYEIDPDEYEDNKGFEKEEYIYYRGDGVMSTESGTIIARPATMVGGEWASCVGHYIPRVAYIRNTRCLTDFEIHVEDCAYADEFGAGDYHRED